MPDSPAVVERTMKVQEVLLQALSGKLTWPQAEEILGWSERTVRRWRLRYQRWGYDGLWDRRRRTPSPRRAPLAEVERILRLYRERYVGFNGRHFYDLARRDHAVTLSYSFIKRALQGAGLLPTRRARAPSPPARAAVVLRGAPAPRRQSPCLAGAGARAAPDADHRRRRCDQAVALCAAARGRREYRGRHDGPPRRLGSLRAAPGAVHRSRALGRPHPARGRRAGPLEAHAAGPGVAPARDRPHPGLLAGGPRPQRAGQPHAPGPARQ